MVSGPSALSWSRPTRTRAKLKALDGSGGTTVNGGGLRGGAPPDPEAPPPDPEAPPPDPAIAVEVPAVSGYVIVTVPGPAFTLVPIVPAVTLGSRWPDPPPPPW